MEFIILRDVGVVLSPKICKLQNLVAKSSEWIEARLQATVEHDCNNSVFLERLHSVLLQELKAKDGEKM